jgi:Helicase conserved C-terminal domain
MSHNLLSCLSSLSMEENRRIAVRCGLWPSTNSKQKLMQETYSRLNQNAYLREALEELDPDERMTLEYLVRQINKNPDATGDGNELVHGLLGTRTGRADRVLQSLVGKCFLFQLQQRGSSIQVLPVDLAERLFKIVGSGRDEWVEEMPGKPSVATDACFFLAHDLVGFLAHLRRTKVRLTQGGVIFRKQREKLQSLIMAPRKPSPFPDSWEHLQHPRGIDFLLLFAQSSMLVHRQAKNIEVHEEALRSFRHSRMTDICGNILSFVDQHFMREYIHLQMTAVALKEAKVGQWYNMERLIEQMAATSARSRWSLEQARFDVLWLLELLNKTGVLDLGLWTKENTWGFCIREQGRQILCGESIPPTEREPLDLRLLPDFTVMVPLQIETGERWQLEIFADLISSDVIITYKVTRDSIYRALKEGLEVESILAFFTQHGERELPQNVEYSIREWAAAFGQIHFADVLLLRCASEELATEISASPEVADYIEGRITPRDLMISRAGYDGIVEALERMGHLPRPLRKKQSHPQ